MVESRTKRVKQNFISNVLNRVIGLALPFVIRTILIQKLGAEYLGLGSLFTSILQVLNMAEVGFSSAIVFSMYKPIAEEKTDEVCALLAFYKKVYRIVGLVILVAGLLLMPFLPHLIKGSYPEDINLYILYLIYLGNTVISYLAFAYKTVLLSASQRQDVISNIDTILALIRSVMQIVFLLVTKNYYLYIIWNVVFTLVNNIVISEVTKKRFPQYVCKGTIDDQKRNAIAQQIKGLAIGKVSKTSRNSFDSVVLSMFCGLVDLAIYSNYYYIFNTVISVIGILVNSLTASIGNSVAIESREKNHYDFKRFNYVFSWLGGWCSICLLCLYQPFMELWAGQALVGSNRIMVLFCIYFYITQMGQARAMYTTAAGIWWELRHYQIAEMIVNLTLNFTLGYFFGMEGILWATIITVFCFSIVGITRVTYRCYFKCSSKEYFIDSVEYAVVTLVGAVATMGICECIHYDGIIGLMFRGVVCVVVPNIIFLVISCMSKRHFAYLSSLIRSVIKTG